jgi:adenylate cyclase
MAKHVLPKYFYSEQQIAEISDLIMHTKFPPQPKTNLEKIICDADLDYLGRTDFIPVSGNLYRELKEHGKIKSIDDWNRLQIKFIENHQYFTETARYMRDVNKIKQLDKLRELI